MGVRSTSGAFGLVKLVREKSTGRLYAMKVLKKLETLRRHQETHVRAERDLMSDCAEVAVWIVRLVYSFQDKDFLYFIMVGSDGLREGFWGYFVTVVISEPVRLIDIGLHARWRPVGAFDSGGYI